ncbi:MAG: hypothetical protein IT426_04465 [Pirellulales bacterium]|nr:hypothetical protein [Pirellulales bacterium]
MGRIYGGILGLLAFQTILVRGWIHQSDSQGTLWIAWLGLILFAAVGLVVGRVAGQIVKESVIGRVNAELAAQEENKKKG